MKRPNSYLILLFFSLSFLFSCQTGIRNSVNTSLIKKGQAGDSTLKLELFVMSKCPYGIESEKAILSALEKFEDKVDFRLFFIAQTYDQSLEKSSRDTEVKEGNYPDTFNKKEGRCQGEPVYEGGKFVSLHGKSEVEEDIRQMVIMHYYPDKFRDYLLFRAENYETDNWEEAAVRAWISIDRIKHISESSEGERLFEKNIRRARELKVSASPVLFINNEEFRGPITYNTISRIICSAISRHQQCKDVPVCGWDGDCVASGKVGLCQNPDTLQARCKFADPVNITLQVIDMPKVNNEEIERMVSISQQLFPAIAIEKIDWTSPRAQELIKRYNLTTLPAFLYSRNIEQSIRYDRLKGSLLLNEDCYVLNPQVFSVLYFPKREERRNQLGIFIEGLNPRDNQIVSQIREMSLFNNYVVKVHFIAKMEKEIESTSMLSLKQDSDQKDLLILSPQQPRITFRSRKGLPEVQEDIRQLCIAQEYPEKYWDYLKCRSAQIINKNDTQTESDWIQCIKEAGIDPLSVEACTISEKGAQFLADEVDFAKDIPIQSGPGFLIHNKWLVKSDNLNKVQELASKIDGR